MTSDKPSPGSLGSFFSLRDLHHHFLGQESFVDKLHVEGSYFLLSNS
jgi:hypothetical protein